jgi:hypothetical protein
VGVSIDLRSSQLCSDESKVLETPTRAADETIDAASTSPTCLLARNGAWAVPADSIVPNPSISLPMQNSLLASFKPLKEAAHPRWSISPRLESDNTSLTTRRSTPLEGGLA